MPTSSVTVRVENVEASRYFDPLRIITAHIHTVGTADGVVLTTQLIREGGFGATLVAASNTTATVLTNAATVAFDLRTDCFETVTGQGLYVAKQGRYHVTVTTGDNQTVGTSATFDVLAASVTELKQLYIQGVDLIASNITSARYQPQAVAGVTIENASTGIMRDIFTLTWDATAKTLVWDGGVPVAIDMTKPFLETMLVNGKKTGYIDIDVTTEKLPTTNQSESIVMDYQQITDDQLRTFMRRAYGHIQSRLYVRLEPTWIDTERSGSLSYDGTVHTDEYMQPVSYYRRNWSTNWFTIKFPIPYVNTVPRLEGWFNSSRAMSVQTDQWLVTNQMAGEVEFVPKQGAILSFQFYGVPSFAYLTQFEHIPSFWHFRMNAGLPDLENDDIRVRVREAILKLAAIETLTLAGLASAPGLLSESTARDGVSESRTYAQDAGGRYAQIIRQHQNFLFGPDGKSGEIAELKRRILGLYFVTL